MEPYQPAPRASLCLRWAFAVFLIGNAIVLFALLPRAMRSDNASLPEKKTEAPDDAKESEKTHSKSSGEQSAVEQIVTGGDRSPALAREPIHEKQGSEPAILPDRKSTRRLRKARRRDGATHPRSGTEEGIENLGVVRTQIGSRTIRDGSSDGV